MPMTYAYTQTETQIQSNLQQTFGIPQQMQYQDSSLVSYFPQGSFAVSNDSSASSVGRQKRKHEVSSSSFATGVTTDASLNAQNKREKVLHNLPASSRSLSLLHIPCNLFKALNSGDLNKVKEIIREVSTVHCALKTPAIYSELYGQQYLFEFFDVIYDTHPDAVWVAKKTRYLEEGEVGYPSLQPGGMFMICSQIHFASTRIAFTATSSSSYLLKRPNSSLLDEMDTSKLSSSDMRTIVDLEARNKNLSLLGVGTLLMTIDSNSKVSKFDFDWKIVSFHEAEI